MRPLTPEETKILFEKLSKYIGENVKLLIDRADGVYCFRLHRDLIYYGAEKKFAGSPALVQIIKVEETEDEIISAFQSVILRMGLDDFKPVFHQILDQWKLWENPTLTTMFNFITKIASSLMNLFSFAVDVVITESTDVIKRTFDVIKGGDNDVMKKDSIENTLLTSILKCVTTTLTYNKVSELSVDQYTAFTSALLSIDQGDEELYDLVEDAIAALAEATEDDMWWQQLNFSVLMAMRSPNNSVRRRMVALIRRFVTSRRDTYLVVLPDAAPFIAELCDDDDQEVDKAAKELISHMETTFGQNLEDYFS